jgi:hypothetical protein
VESTIRLGVELGEPGEPGRTPRGRTGGPGGKPRGASGWTGTPSGRPGRARGEPGEFSLEKLGRGRERASRRKKGDATRGGFVREGQPVFYGLRRVYFGTKRDP